LLPLSLETTGDKSVVGIDGHVAALRTLRSATRALDGVMPQGERPVVIRFGPLRCAERSLETRQSKGVEDGACNGGVDFDRGDAETIDAAACACTMVAWGSGVPGGVSAQSSAAVPAGGETFQKRSLPHGTARLASVIGGPPIFPMEGKWIRGSVRQRLGRVVIVVKITPEVRVIAHLGARFCAAVRFSTTNRRVAGIEWRRSLFGRSASENWSAA
jgi:hypothetical protein